MTTEERREQILNALDEAQADVSGLELERAVRRVEQLKAAQSHLVAAVPLVAAAGLPTVRGTVESALRSVSRQLGRALIKANRLREQQRNDERPNPLHEAVGE